MANDATGTIFGLPNYIGNLFTADQINTPFLSMIGGLNGAKSTPNFQFATSSEYAHEAIIQQNITEDESIAGVTPVNFKRDQSTNVTQIFQEEVLISYVKMANAGRLSGINTQGGINNVVTEKDWQIAKHLESIARSVEWHFLQGTYNLAAASNEANQTRGMIAAAASSVDVSGALDKDHIDELLLAMFNAGATFRNPVIFCGGSQKQKLSDIYGYAPSDRNVGGVNIKQIETDFGNIGVAPAHRLMPVDTLLIADVSVISAVSQPVPGKGHMFYEELSKTGAAESGQLFGMLGLDHGPTFMHGVLINLT